MTRFTVWVEPVVPNLADPQITGWQARVHGPPTRDGAGPIVETFAAPFREDAVTQALALRERLNAITWGEWVKGEAE